jgi:hypothetical protein
MLNDFHYNLLDVANKNNLLEIVKAPGIHNDLGGKSTNNKNSI